MENTREKDESIFFRSSGGRTLSWLADAPMFIDGEQVSALYNAVAKPEHETEVIKLNVEDSKEFKGSVEVGAEAKVSTSAILKMIFPFLDAEVKGTAKASGSGGTGKKTGTQLELRPVNTPQRQLVQLALHYWINLPFRTRAITDFTNLEWMEPTFVAGLPKGLVFLEFPPGTGFVPMAAEIDDGKVQLIYSDLVDKICEKFKVEAPTDPDPAKFKGKLADFEAVRKCYFEFFETHFDSKMAMEAVEKSAQDAKKSIRWIDYRVPISKDRLPLHLHASARGQYDTGTFAYQLVRRGHRHGLRVVGTMKSGPAMNVLAIFER